MFVGCRGQQGDDSPRSRGGIRENLLTASIRCWHAPMQLSGLPRVFVHALAFSSTPSHANAAEFSSTPSHAALLQRHGAAAPHRAVMGIKRRPVERPVEHACAEAPHAPRNRRRLSACLAPVACSPPNRRIPGRLLRGRRHSTRHVTGRHLHERRHRDISAGEVTSSASRHGA